jgi:Tol biopolymer transport system component
MPDGRELVFAAGLNFAASTLHRMAAEAGAQERDLAGTGVGAYSPAVSSQGNRLAYGFGATDSNIWAVDLGAAAATMYRPLSSTFRDVFPQFSPDGARVALSSNRSGSLQIWVANRDGSQAVALTALAGPTTNSPRWSPDGQQIAFDSNTGEEYGIYAISAEGGRPRLLAPKPAFGPSWSHDGRWIYFSRPVSGHGRIFKVPAQGGDVVQIAAVDSAGVVESPDGKSLYYSHQSGAAGLWKMPVEGGPETQVLPDVYRFNYAITPRGIYFTPRDVRDGTSSVQFLSFATGKTAEIVKVLKPLDLGLTISPDGRTLLYTQTDYTTRDLMLVENFR